MYMFPPPVTTYLHTYYLHHHFTQSYMYLPLKYVLLAARHARSSLACTAHCTVHRDSLLVACEATVNGHDGNLRNHSPGLTWMKPAARSSILSVHLY